MTPFIDSILEQYFWSLPVTFQWLIVAVTFSSSILLCTSLYYWKYPVDQKKSLATIDRQMLHPPIPLHVVMHIGWIAPVFSIIASLIISYFFHFEASTSFKTDCNVQNPLPSISYAIGSNVPERWIFSIGIVLMSHERIFNLLMYYYWFQKYLPADEYLHWLNSILYNLNWVENLGLLAVSLISAVEYPFLHEKSFHAWAIFQQLKMMLLIYLHKRLARHPKKATAEKALKYRVWLWRINLASLFIGLILIQLDIHYCIEFLYSFIAVIEYIIVGTNVAFNYCVIYDFPDKVFLVTQRVNDPGWVN